MTKNPKEIVLQFQAGSLVLENSTKDHEISLFPEAIWDERVLYFRAKASSYRELVLYMETNKIPYRDESKNYEALKDLSLVKKIEPREHQHKALVSWIQNGGKGVVSLPTGAGKTILAILAMEKVQRSTLIVVPTIDLLEQWYNVVYEFFGIKAGQLGGGSKEIKSLTISTYDSAHLYVESIGNRFGFIIFDECHHLPAPQYKFIAEASLAPYRLGLSATVERADGLESIIYDLLGEKVYHGYIVEMANNVLAPYDVVTLEVPMSDKEQEQYESERKIYINFIRRNRISMSSRDGWQNFLFMASRSKEGMRAIKAHREQKKLAQASSEKIIVLFKLLEKHKQQKSIVFTDDNALAYKIGTQFILPVLTHQTKLVERKKILQEFKSGDLRVIVTSKVLNEGVDVPDATIGIVLSGGGGVREHVQRLGRILRQKPGKRAILYEVISKNTSEYYVNKRRTRHDAYERSSEVFE